MIKIKLINDFHNTVASIRVLESAVSYNVEFGEAEVEISVTQFRRFKKALCGVSGCRCGVIIQRGITIAYWPEGERLGKLTLSRTARENFTNDRSLFQSVTRLGEVVKVLERHGAFTYGSMDRIEGIAEEWTDLGYSPNRVNAWLSAGCFSAYAAERMTRAGLAPEMVERFYKDSTYSVGYLVANGDLSVGEAKDYVEVNHE